MTMPNFLVIGAAKAGTTALHRYLKQHPQIFMSYPKELRFFPFENQRPNIGGPGDEQDATTMITTLEDYQACFAAGADYVARGESSPLYLYYPRSAERIHHYLSDVKLIAILRDPADRTYSHFLARKRDGFEPLSFADALDAEDQRTANGWNHHWHYRQRSFYAAQLQRYFDLFKREQIKIYLYEDYYNDPAGLMRDLFSFLNVDDTFIPDMSIRHNESKIPRNRALQIYLREPRGAKNFVKQFVPTKLSRRVGNRLRSFNLIKLPIPKKQRQRLIDEYRGDILKLQDMLGRDLSHWLK